MELTIDPEFQALIPPLAPEEKAQLEANLLQDGCRDPLVTWTLPPERGGECECAEPSWSREMFRETDLEPALHWKCAGCGAWGFDNDSILIDGHNRYEICTRHGLDFETIGQEFLDRAAVKEWIINNQFGRRNLPAYQRAKLALELESIYRAKAKENQIASGEMFGRGQDEKVLEISPKPFEPINTRVEIAKVAGVSDNTIARVKRIEERGTPEQKAKLSSGEVSINEVFKAVKKEERRESTLEKENAALETAGGEVQWTITAAQDVVQCAALITDPPYGILAEPWEPEKLEEFTREWATRWNHCSADTAFIFWSQRHLFDGRKWFDECLSEYSFQQLLVWHYPNNKSPQSRMGFKQTWEPIYFYRKKDSCRLIGLSGGNWGDGLNDFDCHVAAVPQSNFNDQNMKQHPAQKPVSVFRWLINAATQAGEMVCDPFAGSGTSGIAAAQLKRPYHGVEIDPDFIELAKRRIATYGK